MSTTTTATTLPKVGMQRAAYFASGQSGAGQKKNLSGRGGAGPGLESSSGAVLKIFRVGAAIFPGARAGAKLYYTSFWDKFGMNINYFGMHPKT